MTAPNPAYDVAREIVAERVRDGEDLPSIVREYCALWEQAQTHGERQVWHLLWHAAARATLEARRGR